MKESASWLDAEEAAVMGHRVRGRRGAIKRLVIMAESMGIFSCLTLLCVCLLFLSLFLSLLRALGWGCSLGFCLLLREMAAGVLVGLVVGFFV